jgi:hypothetical protein
VTLEIISKVLLKHQNLKTTQVYLGKVSDTEAILWMDNRGVAYKAKPGNSKGPRVYPWGFILSRLAKFVRIS